MGYGKSGCSKHKSCNISAMGKDTAKVTTDSVIRHAGAIQIRLLLLLLLLL